MVSHSVQSPPAYSDLTLSSITPSAPPLTYAPSVTSRSSHTTRRHRHARTHHGGSSARIPQNEFPIFSLTGDVEIVISNARGNKENRYVLHRLILSQCSGFFEAGTRSDWNGASQSTPRGGSVKSQEYDAPSTAGSSGSGAWEQRASTELAVVEGSQTWRYVVDWTGAQDGEPPMLVQRNDASSSIFAAGRNERPPPVRNKPPASSENFFRSMTNFSALNLNDRSSTEGVVPGDEILKDYDNLFRTMYQYPPILDSANIATAYTECKALLHLADMYDALEIVGTRADHHLLRFGARLFKQIAKYPPSYLKLGYLARSPTIFTEAMIHVVGQWPSGGGQLRNQVNTTVLDLIEDKVDELREQEERAEFKLWRLTLTTSRGERITPSNDYLAWLAISLFRQWLAENTTPAPAGILKDNSRPGANTTARHGRSSSQSSSHAGSQRVASATQPPAQSASLNAGRVYRLIGSTSNEAYLNHDELKRFLKLQPELYNRDNIKRLERRMNEVKNLARDAVAPLMRNFLELDLSAFGPAGLGYLTCTKLTTRELPWEV